MKFEIDDKTGHIFNISNVPKRVYDSNENTADTIFMYILQSVKRTQKKRKVKCDKCGIMIDPTVITTIQIPTIDNTLELFCFYCNEKRLEDLQETVK